MKENYEIHHEHAVLCEGADEKYFLISYFNSKTLRQVHPGFADNIDIFDFGGNQDLPGILNLFQKTPGYSALKSLLIIRDAEADARKAVSEIRHALQRNDLPVPENPCQWEEGTPKVSFLLFPSCSSVLEDGALENLCLKLLVKKLPEDVPERVDQFLRELEKERGSAFPRRFKNQLHTDFSVTDQLGGMKVGEAAKANAFDWESPILDPFRKHMLEVL